MGTEAKDVDAQALDALNKLLVQYEGYQSCRDMLQRVVKAKTTLAETEAAQTAMLKKVADLQAKASGLEADIEQKQKEIEARNASRKASLQDAIKDVQDQLDRKQRDLDGWHLKAQQEVADHDRLIRDMQAKLAQVQAEYREAVSKSEEAKAHVASLMQKFGMAVPS